MSHDDSQIPALTGSASDPFISVIMANHRGAAHLPAAMAAVLAQTQARIELILADDASDDDSATIARRIAEDDTRVRVIVSDRNQGPAATRNLGLDAARGDWIAIVDSDDLIHPQRLSRLVAAAEAAGADIAADDLVHFGNAESRTLLQTLSPTPPVLLGAADLLAGHADPRQPAYGYLKPVIRRAALAGRRYDTALRIGEDHDLVLRMVMAGARFLLLPDPLYAYRRHANSISHRLSVETVAAMLAAHEALPPMPDPTSRAAARAAGRQLRRSLRYERLVEAIKARHWSRALPALADPAMLVRLAGSLQDRRRRAAAARQGTGVADQRLAPVIPPLPAPGAAWAAPPAPAAAWIVAQVTSGSDLPPGLPPWAEWLAGAVRDS
ncbi:glycosyltransferase family 2 protein [Paracoccus contaminans]|uniref:Glycosyltransferase 2-like domain-containing protein n=1 Tax=Paracoccus contaminans TaxID=1945662 RepID=A0A1W6D072_9RHOB|nr:glycosyltransferase family 2 protein [Paracoccus contaminans]ARJ70465.1 hypothetical protein B0A89_13270 [Paracoccus contaminans]